MIVFDKSAKLFREAKNRLAGGVNSPVRAYRDFDFPPPFIKRAAGSRLWDADGNEYVDYVGSWGPMILGHAHPSVVEAVKMAAEHGTSYGAPTEGETELAELVKRAFPSIDLLRFVNSGTEAVMSSVRLARAYTGRPKIIKFNGCYHGHADHLLVKAGSGAASMGIPDSEGVPAEFAVHTLVAEYNDIDSVKTLIENYSNSIAAIIVEPVAANMGCVPPKVGFLQDIRSMCDKNNILLIFDEVVTGFRLAFGGAQEFYKISADLTCLGKILGGGLPMGAYGGRKDIMEMISPMGPVYQAGTLSGNPLAVAAGIATLKELNLNLYSSLEKTAEILVGQMQKIFFEKDIPVTINRVGSLFSAFFSAGPVSSYSDVKKCNQTVFKKYFKHMLNEGIYFAPSQYEAAFISTAHCNSDIEKTIDALSGFK